MRSIGALERDLAKFAAALNYLTRNRWGTVTLTPSATTTTIYDPGLNPDSIITFDALTASAASAMPRPYVAEADRGFGVFAITHTSDAATDRVFRWVASGD